MNKEEIINKVCNCFKMNITLNELEKIIVDLQKQAELGEHYKHLYSEVKKQKDDVVEYIKSHNPSDIGICGIKTKYYYTLDEDSVDEILRMLGEIDE